MVVKLKINIEEYSVKSNFNSKIVLLTDIHYDSKRNIKHLYKLLDSIYKIKPNYICISGDFINRTDLSDADLFFKWLSDLSKICKVIIGIGNHDVVQFNVNHDCRCEELFNEINKISNVHLLDNKMYEDENINFIGLTFPWKYYYVEGENPISTKKYINHELEIKKGKYNILLCHSPYSITMNDDIKLFNECDLILSGHMHAGCVFKIFRKVLKGRGIFSPVPHSKRFFQKNMYGYIKEKNLIISSGVTKLSDNTLIRGLNCLFDSEIVVINIMS